MKNMDPLNTGHRRQPLCACTGSWVSCPLVATMGRSMYTWGARVAPWSFKPRHFPGKSPLLPKEMSALTSQNVVYFCWKAAVVWPINSKPILTHTLMYFCFFWYTWYLLISPVLNGVEEHMHQSETCEIFCWLTDVDQAGFGIFARPTFDTLRSFEFIVPRAFRARLALQVHKLSHADSTLGQGTLPTINWMIWMGVERSWWCWWQHSQYSQNF